ncbi:MAG: hypothetical protein KJN60_11240 [Boseongicola sp.]|nr:hypothetical protein [Boseongicola sp.]
MNTYLLRRKRTRGTARMAHFAQPPPDRLAVYQSSRNAKRRTAAKLRRYLRIARAAG